MSKHFSSYVYLIILFINISIMNKLDLIRQKYGYATTSNPNVPETTSQRLKSIRKDDQRNFNPLHYNQHQLSHNRISLFLLDSPANNSKHHRQPKQVDSRIQANPVPPSKATALACQKVPDLNQSFVKSYEKTYDLLKNYRNRILTSAQRPASQSKSKLILNPNNGQTACTFTQQQEVDIKEKENKSIAQVKQRLSSKKQPQRCSPLQGMDLQSSVNIYGEIQNISRLQSRIHQLIRDKSIR